MVSSFLSFSFSQSFSMDGVIGGECLAKSTKEYGGPSLVALPSRHHSWPFGFIVAETM